MNKEDDETKPETPSLNERYEARRRRRLRKPHPSQHEAGYGRPPVEHQFKKGLSGNPSGRPIGAVNKPPVQMERLKQSFLELADEEVKVSKAGQTLTMRKIDYLLQLAFDKAAKGDTRLQKFLLTTNLDFEHEAKELQTTYVQSAIEYKKYWDAELFFRKEKGITNLPLPVPHPDDVIVDRYGNVKITGPITPEEKQEDDEIDALHQTWKKRLDEIEAEFKACRAQLKDRRFSRKRIKSKLQKLTLEKFLLILQLKETERSKRYIY